MPTGKITKSEFRKEWGNDKGTFFSHAIEVEGIGSGEISAKEKNPSFLNVGETIELEVKETEYGKKFKRIMPQRGGFGPKKPQVMPFSECKRIAKSNAVHALVTVNNISEEERLKSDQLAPIVAFSLGGISGDIIKWGEDHNDFISRLAAVSNAALHHKVKWCNSGAELVANAEKLYKYVIS